MTLIKITSNEANQRLDRYLRKYLKDTSLSEIYRMIRRKDISVNERRVKENYRLIEGDALRLPGNRKDCGDTEVKKCSRDFAIIYEDDNVIIVDKPPGLILHPDEKHRENTLTDQVIFYLYETGQYMPGEERTFRPASANRLDVNTGGIVLFAKNYSSLQCLNEIIRNRFLEKHYICIVRGHFEGFRDIKAYICKDEWENISKISYEPMPGCREIHTGIKHMVSLNDYSLLEVNLFTGRSHQIRAQLSSIGYPIIGDGKYGDSETNSHFRSAYNLRSQFLYAYKVIFKGDLGMLDYLDQMEFSSKLPGSYRHIMEELFNCSVEQF
jgi:23S rRNA pseudouridine955/2504/2580 synthase